ncbi:MAG TPA: nucleoside triphosphate pyrophosphohydrolase [Armatimonadaceae bacterium]|nr:nucleoside triphosphate pyrophosphohydrolase [Armatimonadaceae bacterium]
MLYVVGLGPGSPDALPARNLSLLTSGAAVLLRTARHPVLESGPVADALSGLPAGVVTALDDEYERSASFEETYVAIVRRVLDAYDRAAREGGELVYAVPGHPLVGESTVALLLAEAKASGIAVRVVGAPSFVDAALEALMVAVTGDLHVVDALTLDSGAPNAPAALRTGGPLLLYQVHSRAAASEAKLALMRAGYPDEFPVTVLRAAGIPGREATYTTPLHDLDRTDGHDHLTSVFVPELPADRRRPAFAELVSVMARLRDPDGGCPWDLKQSHETLRRYVIEEAFEVVDAIDSEDPDLLCEELGDLLLQVVFHAQLAREEGVFDVDDVSAGIVEKLIRRHPHIFGEVKVAGADEVLDNWNAIKAAEKGTAKEDPESILDGIPKSYPALVSALEVSRRAVKAGFEWPDASGVLDKVEEEIAELREEMLSETPDAGRIAWELGDLLFTLVNVGRKCGIDAESALRAQIERFKRRFRHIERRAADAGSAVDALSLDEMEAFWREAKAQEGTQGA